MFGDVNRKNIRKAVGLEPELPEWAEEFRQWVQEATKSGRMAEVHEWLSKNPPPDDWENSALEYAFTEMPWGW